MRALWISFIPILMIGQTVWANFEVDPSTCFSVVLNVNLERQRVMPHRAMVFQATGIRVTNTCAPICLANSVDLLAASHNFNIPAANQIAPQVVADLIGEGVNLGPYGGLNQKGVKRAYELVLEYAGLSGTWRGKTIYNGPDRVFEHVPVLNGKDVSEELASGRLPVLGVIVNSTDGRRGGHYLTVLKKTSEQPDGTTSFLIADFARERPLEITIKADGSIIALEPGARDIEIQYERLNTLLGLTVEGGFEISN